jgi:hypothetical protein
MTLDQAKEAIGKAFPSVFTKEDILSILNQVEEPKAEDKLTQKVAYELISKIQYEFGNLGAYNVVDRNSATFCLRGGYEIELEDLDINTSEIDDIVERVINDMVDKSAE